MEKIGNIYQCPKCKEEYNNRPFFWTDRVATEEEVKDEANKCINCPPTYPREVLLRDRKIEYKSVHSYDEKLDYYLCKGHKENLKKSIKAFNERPPVIKGRRNEDNN